MIASVLKLSRADCKALKITDPYSIHRTVYTLFPQRANESRDFLFADKGGDFRQRRILILSKRAPQIPEYGNIESKAIPEPFLNFDSYGFEVRLNPVKRDNQSRKITAIRSREKLGEWFCAKSESWGFQTIQDSLQIQSIGLQSFEKEGRQVIQNTACFIGRLHVKDRNLFIKSFEQGIGRGKSFGFGLLEIVPLQR